LSAARSPVDDVSGRTGTGGLWAVVPVNRFDQTKQRLAAVLAPAARSRLARAMFQDVLKALRQSRSLAGVMVVTGDAEAARMAREAGAEVIHDEAGAGTAAAVALAVRTLAAAGRAGMLVVPADVPLITAEDVEALIAAHAGHDGLAGVTLVPAEADGGTNALVCSPPDALPPCFGTDSFARHVQAARERDIEPVVLRLPRIGRDIDRPEDLEAFMKAATASHTEVWRTMKAGAGDRLSREDCLALADCTDLAALMRRAAARRDAAHGNLISYSRKVFIPLTRLCRDVCHYCTFAKSPSQLDKPYLSLDEVLAIARAGAAAGCKEALFTLGDQPELRYRAAREALDAMGYASTIDYLVAAARAVQEQTGLLPHANPGLLTAADLAALRQVSVSQGIMLESASERLCQRGGPHFGSPDKLPAARLETLRLAGEAAVPFTSGILIGIGETRIERIEALLALRDLQDRHGHLQEIIIQNFLPKPDTLMAGRPGAAQEEHLWTIAAARLIFDPDMAIQAPPNLSPGALRPLIAAGINDWGGVSPVTPDHVNPEAPWPHLDALARETAAAGKILVERLAIYPAYAHQAERWVDQGLRLRLAHCMDADGFARTDAWTPGAALAIPREDVARLKSATAAAAGSALARLIDKAQAGTALTEAEIVQLFGARGEEFAAVCAAADAVRAGVKGDEVSYVVNRNINYTNLCTHRCGFCAFSKGQGRDDLRGVPYDLADEEIARRVREAWERGATEVCMQGGIHPGYTGGKYLALARLVKATRPQMHLHAFSPLEVTHGAKTMKLSVREFLVALKEAGLDTLPGTAAEILDDEVRALICPDKLNTAAWLQVMREAHGLGLRSTATIMFGHVDRPVHWARHLMRIRELQSDTGGFTEFVPLPFVHMEAPMSRHGAVRPGPTFREVLLMHAVARLVLHPLIGNIQASWVKLGPDGVAAALAAGVNDLGGTLMNESISRAAGAEFGQEMPPQRMDALIHAAGRRPRVRTTLYATPPAARIAQARQAIDITPIVLTPVDKLRYRNTAQKPAHKTEVIEP